MRESNSRSAILQLIESSRLTPLIQIKDKAQLIQWLRSKNAIDVQWIELDVSRANGEARVRMLSSLDRRPLPVRCAGCSRRWEIDNPRDQTEGGRPAAPARDGLEFGQGGHQGRRTEQELGRVCGLSASFVCKVISSLSRK